MYEIEVVKTDNTSEYFEKVKYYEFNTTMDFLIIDKDNKTSIVYNMQSVDKVYINKVE